MKDLKRLAATAIIAVALILATAYLSRQGVLDLNITCSTPTVSVHGSYKSAETTTARKGTVTTQKRP